MTSKPPSEKLIRQRIELALKGESHRLRHPLLKSEAAWPLVIEALSDPRAEEPYPNDGPNACFAYYALRYCLQGAPIPLPVLLRLLDSTRCRSVAIGKIGSRGTVEAGRVLGELLEYPDPETAERALRAFHPPDRMITVELGYLDQVWPAIRKVAPQLTPRDFAERVVSVIWQHDLRRTLVLLDELDALNPQGERLHPILVMLNREESTELGAERLLPILEASYGAIDQPWPWAVFSLALQILARTDPVAAERWLERIADNRDADLIDLAAEVRVILDNIDTSRLPDLPMEPADIYRIKPVYRDYLLACDFNAQVMMDGLNHFLYSTGYWAHLAQEALLALGASAEAELLAEAIVLFQIPDALRAKLAGRNRLLRRKPKLTPAEFTALHDAILAGLEQPEVKAGIEKLDRKYYTLDTEGMHYYCREYTRKHARHFKRK